MIRFAWVVYGRLLTEQISIMTLNPILKERGFEAFLIYSNKKKDILNKIERLKPKIIGYSLMYGSHWSYIGLSRIIRERFPYTFQVLGGPLATFYPNVINQFSVNAVGIGEGDISLPNLIKKLEDNENIEDVKGFEIKCNGRIKNNELQQLLEDLDSLPFPDRELFYAQDSLLRNQEFKSFMSGRGCPYPCTYCFNHKFNEMFKGKGKIIRKKSVDYFIEEIKDTRDRYGCQFAIFEDDIFIINRAWLEEFTAKFKRRVNMPYICYIRPDLVDEEILKLLKEGGCRIVRMAIESGNETIRNTILKRNMSNSTIIRASDLVHKYGLKLSVSNMLGLPTETIEAVNDTVKLNIRCRPEHPTAQFFMPYPNMELSNIAIEKGYFNEGLLGKIPKNTWKITPLIFDKKTKRYIEKIQKIFALIVRFPSLKKFTNLIFVLPDSMLYLISILCKIIIVANYFPTARVDIKQRLRVLFRFFDFYA